MSRQRYQPHYQQQQQRRLRLLQDDDDTNDHDDDSNQHPPPASEPIILQILEGLLVFRIIITILCVINNNTSLRPFQYYLEIINNIGWMIICALCIRRLLIVHYYYYYNKNHHHHHHQWWWWITIDRPIASIIHDVLGACNSTNGDDTWKDQVRNFLTGLRSYFSSVVSAAQQSKMNICDFLQNSSKFDGPHNDLKSGRKNESRNITSSEFLETIRTWFRDRFNRAWDFQYSRVHGQEFYYDTSTKEDRTSLLTPSSSMIIESGRHNSGATINAPSRIDLDRGMEIEMVNSHLMMGSSSNYNDTTRIHGNSRKDL